VVHAHVLVVEDEVLIRDFVSEELTAAGFDVIQVGTADEAISVLEECQNVHLVFTDIDMIGSMDGLRLAAAIRDRCRLFTSSSRPARRDQ
jgi:CheY-like chemotaxis protein